MGMVSDGLVKLTEECGELIQIAAKNIAYPNLDYPDGTNVNEGLQDELADVLACIWFVISKKELDGITIANRAYIKLNKYKAWDDE